MISFIQNGSRAAGISAVKCLRSVCLFIVIISFFTGRLYPQSQTASQAPATVPESSLEALAHARTSVEKLFARSANVACTETVTQTILDENDRTAYQEHSLFNYRLQTDTGGKSLKFVESRETLEAPFRDPSRTLLMTDGFGNMLLILHPAYVASYTFEPDGGEVMDGVSTLKFRFKAVPGASSPVMLQVRGRNYSVALDGTVWIEPQSGSVVKLAAFTSSNMDDLGVHRMSSEIQYLRADFHNPEESYWMPASAIIDVETAHRHWRNIHRFTAYKRFQGATPIEERAGTQETSPQ